MAKQERTYTLITGASTGLGKSFALECAKMGRNLLLASLPGENLPELARQIAGDYGVDVAFYEIDLTEEHAIKELAGWVQDNYRLDFLINNAGFGGSRILDKTPFDYLDKMIKLNVRATSLLTYLLLPELKTHPQAHVLNVASTIVFNPVAYKTFYPGTKSFIYFLSRGLNLELKGTGVHVSVLLAGPMRTNAFVTESIDKLGWKSNFITLETERMAAITLKQTLAGKTIIIPGLANKFSVLLSRIMPAAIRLPALSRNFLKEIERKGLYAPERQEESIPSGMSS
jgi:short-subunit dehydrogenase